MAAVRLVINYVLNCLQSVGRKINHLLHPHPTASISDRFICILCKILPLVQSPT